VAKIVSGSLRPSALDACSRIPPLGLASRRLNSTVGRRRRWFQLSLKSLFGLTLLVATFCAGYSLRAKQEEAERRRAESEAQQAVEAARLKAHAAEVEYAAAVARAFAVPQKTVIETGPDR
jgi:predicted negative regulator of RcsB-dependent stress response